MRAVDCFVASRGPAGAALNESGMIAAADEELSRDGLLLIMALEAQRLVARLQHLRVYRAVWVVTRGAIVTQRFVFENEGAALRLVAFQAGVIRALKLRAAADDRIALVRFVTVAAGHFPVGDRVAVLQGELTAFIEMALIARLRISRRIDDVVGAAAFLGMHAAGSVARLAADVFGVFAGREEFRVRGIMKASRDVLVALSAVLGADKFRARNLRRHHHRSIHHDTGYKQQAPNGCAAKNNGIPSPRETKGHGGSGEVGCPGAARWVTRKYVKWPERLAVQGLRKALRGLGSRCLAAPTSAFPS